MSLYERQMRDLHFATVDNAKLRQQLTEQAAHIERLKLELDKTLSLNHLLRLNKTVDGTLCPECQHIFKQ